MRVQWDPERDRQLQPIPGRRSLQLGFAGEAANRYVDEWTVTIADVTDLAHRVRAGEAAPLAEEVLNGAFGVLSCLARLPEIERLNAPAAA